MKTAEKVLREVTDLVSNKLGINISFQHGNTQTVINHITEIVNHKEAFPSIVMFTEGLTESFDGNFYEFKIPKIAICTMTVSDATEKQRLESNFENIVYPIFKVFSDEIKKIHHGYKLIINRTDIAYTSNSGKNEFYQLVDGCIIKDLRLKLREDEC